MRRYVTAFLAALLLATAAPAGADTPQFTDIDGSVHAADIATIAELGITKGCTPTLYCPEDEVTRGQMAAFMQRAAYPLNTGLPDAFPDIADSIFRDEINTLGHKGIVSGIGVTNNFQPDWPLSRIEQVRWMFRAGWCGHAIANIEVFDDVTLEDPVLAADVPYVWACHEAGMVRGYEGSMFPWESVTRAQMASFLVRAVG